MPVDGRLSACVNDFRNAGFTKSMQRVLGIQAFTEGILLLSPGGDAF